MLVRLSLPLSFQHFLNNSIYAIEQDTAIVNYSSIKGWCEESRLTSAVHFLQSFFSK